MRNIKKNIKKLVCLLCSIALVVTLVQEIPSGMTEVQAGDSFREFLEKEDFYVGNEQVEGDYFSYDATTDTYSKLGGGWQNYNVAFLFTNQTYEEFALEFDVQFCPVGGVPEPEVKIEFGKQTLGQTTTLDKEDGAVCLRLFTTSDLKYLSYVHTTDGWGNQQDNFSTDVLHHVKVLVENGKYSVVMDDLTLIDGFDLPANYQAGHVGIGTGAEGMTISNITIENLKPVTISFREFLEKENFYVGNEQVEGDYFSYDATTDTYSKLGGGWNNYNVAFLFTEQKLYEFALDFDVKFCKVGGVPEPEVKIEFGKQTLGQTTTLDKDDGAVCLRLLTDSNLKYNAYIHTTDGWGSSYDNFSTDDLHHVRVLVKDGKYSVIMDNLTMINQYDLPANYQAGHVGIGTGAEYTEGMYISNIKIDSQEPATLFSGFDAYTIASVDTFWLNEMSAADFAADWRYCGNGMIGRTTDGDTKAVYSKESYTGDMTMDFKFTSGDGDNTIYVGFGASKQGGRWATWNNLQDPSPTIIRIHGNGQIAYAPTSEGKDWWFPINTELYDTVAKKGAVHSCHIEITGDQLTVYVDGTNQGTITMQNYAGGHVFLGGWTRAVSFSVPQIALTSLTEAQEAAFEGYVFGGLKEPAYSIYQPINFTPVSNLSNYWYNDANGMIHRKSTGDGVALYLKDAYTTNIRLTVNYTSKDDVTNNWGAFIGFGAQTKGADWYTDANSPAVNIIRLHHTGACGFAPLNAEGGDDWVQREKSVTIPATDYEKVHTAVVELKYNTCYVWLDGTYKGSHELVNYEGGYIFLAAYKDDVSFSIPTVETITPTKLGNAESKAYGKKALFVGDSISDGAGDQAAWANRLGYHFDMITKNNSHGGWVIANDPNTPAIHDNGAGSIQTQLTDELGTAYDYIIIEGGINDIMQNTNYGNNEYCKLGSISSSMDSSTFDTTTFAGGLENLFYNATTQFGNAAVGYIMTYQTAEGWIADWGVAQQYVDTAKEICKKWNVSYLCLWDYDDIKAQLFADQDKNIADGLHTSVDGYDIMDPIITRWFSGLSTKDYAKGYVNGDTNLDVRDLISLKKEVVKGTKTHLTSADFDDNFVIDDSDAAAMRTALVK